MGQFSWPQSEVVKPRRRGRKLRILTRFAVRLLKERDVAERQRTNAEAFSHLIFGTFGTLPRSVIGSTILTIKIFEDQSGRHFSGLLRRLVEANTPFLLVETIGGGMIPIERGGTIANRPGRTKFGILTNETRKAPTPSVSQDSFAIILIQ